MQERSVKRRTGGGVGEGRPQGCATDKLHALLKAALQIMKQYSFLLPNEINADFQLKIAT